MEVSPSIKSVTIRKRGIVLPVLIFLDFLRTTRVSSPLTSDFSVHNTTGKVYTLPTGVSPPGVEDCEPGHTSVETYDDGVEWSDRGRR